MKGRMNAFNEQLAATRASLERLEQLAAQAPDLLDGGSLIEVAPNHARIFQHGQAEPVRDWLALVRKYPAGWEREPCASYRDRWDWAGTINGVEITIIGAEQMPKAQPLFAESESREIVQRIDKAMAETPIVEEVAS